MPALHMRTSSLVWVNCLRPVFIEKRDVKSHWMKVSCAVGVIFLASLMRSLARLTLRPVK